MEAYIDFSGALEKTKGMETIVCSTFIGIENELTENITFTINVDY